MHSSPLAVGIPAGVYRDPQTDAAFGVIRRQGETVELDIDHYTRWSVMLVPLPPAAIGRIGLAHGDPAGRPTAVLERLHRDHLVVDFDAERPSERALTRLRPLPLGCCVGAHPDSGGVVVQNSNRTLSTPLVVSDVAAVLLWEIDGLSCLATLRDRLREIRPELTVDQAGSAVGRLVHHLMRRRLLYLDWSDGTGD